ncbi:helix-turn-helix transcriptional regulator [Cohnella candidum]|uniref:AraC family transcriptional regulator n=1 Tax=Cohnella candidum TaxID=2674991 RepID=A0A3G3K3Z7_9BACL|nr:AraC family transcriptional regulator [Cohnella candidum]AYQ75162.1 AraC family transcriptional regulator [Cohnella candidum]
MIEFSHEFAEHWYHTPNALEKHSGIIPIRIGYNEAKPNYRIGPRFIVYFSLHFVLKGHVTLRWDHEEVILRRGDLFALFPHQIHKYNITPDSEEPLKMFWIAAEGKQMPSLIRRLGLTPQLPYLKAFFSPSFEASLFHLANQWEDLTRKDDFSLTHAFYALLNQLLQMSQPPQSSASTDDWISKSLAYIHLNYMEGITIRDIAEHVGIHRSHFSNIFNKKVGVRPQQYLMNLLMKKAMEMVSTTTMPITHIALSLGYSDVYSFTHSFKGFYGESPSFYRKTPQP